MQVLKGVLPFSGGCCLNLQSCLYVIDFLFDVVEGQWVSNDNHDLAITKYADNSTGFRKRTMRIHY